jgi:hypothetical protein
MHNFRVRAIVDGVPTEWMVLARGAEEAVVNFSRIDPMDGSPIFGELPIELAMVHAVTFEEDGPKFHEHTGMVSDKWARCSFKEACSFYEVQPRVEQELYVGPEKIQTPRHRG